MNQSSRLTDRAVRLGALKSMALVVAMYRTGFMTPNVLAEGPPERRSRVGNREAQLLGGPLEAMVRARRTARMKLTTWYVLHTRFQYLEGAQKGTPHSHSRILLDT